MSFILDALKKSEQNHQRKTLPGLQTQHQNNAGNEKKPIPWLWLLLVFLFFNSAFLLTFTLYTEQKEDTIPEQTSNVAVPETPVLAIESDKTSSTPGQILDQLPDKKPIETNGHIYLSSSGEASLEVVKETTGEDNKENVASIVANSESTVEQRESNIYLEPDLDSNIGEMTNESSIDSGLLPNDEIPSMEVIEFGEQTVQFEAEKEVGQIIPDYDQLPAVIKKNIPDISISFHAYSQKRSSRIVSINGRIIREGQEIASELKLDEITTDGVILNYKGERFKMKVF